MAEIPDIPDADDVLASAETTQSVADLENQVDDGRAHHFVRDNPREVATGDSQATQAAQEATPSGAGPVGDGDWVVREGDCISSIANATGHFWETIWNDAANSELQEARGNPFVLLPGDRVTVPELTRKDESRPAEQHHRFRRLGEPVPLRLRLLEEPEREDIEGDEATGATQPSDNSQRQGADQRQPGQSSQQQGSQQQPARQDDSDEPEAAAPVQDVPRANVPYVLDVEGVLYSGTTDSDGKLEVFINPAAREGTLSLYPGTEDEEVIPVMLGQLAPITEISGVKDRLSNLGFSPGNEGEEQDKRFEAALRAFQKKAGLPQTGEPDQATRDKLVELVGN